MLAIGASFCDLEPAGHNQIADRFPKPSFHTVVGTDLHRSLKHISVHPFPCMPLHIYQMKINLLSNAALYEEVVSLHGWFKK